MKHRHHLGFGMIFLKYLPTVEWGPTLSAGRKILVAVKAAHYRQPQSFGDMVLTDRGFATEFAQ